MSATRNRVTSPWTGPRPAGETTADGDTDGEGSSDQSARAERDRASATDRPDDRHEDREPKSTETGSATEADSPTIMLVDDEEDLVDAYAMWLEETYTVRKSYSGTEAIERLDGVDIVFLDRKMPGLSGEDVLRRIRDRGTDCHVAMLSALKPDSETAKLDVDAYLQKPVTAADLRAAIDELMARGDER